MEELRLPKCLTEKERRGILEYNEILLQNFAPNEREGMRREIFMPRDDKWIYCPFEEYSPWGSTMPFKFEENHMNKALDEALRKVLTEKSRGYKEGDLLLFFNRAYAIANHIQNHADSVYTLKSYLEIWEKKYDTSCLTELWGIYFSRLPTPLCKHICASMVFCILDHEDENRPDELLQEIEWLLQASQDGIDTLKVFQEKVATANEQTEENTPSEEQPKAEPPLEKKEEETAPTLSDDDIKTAICTLQEEGYLDEKVRYLGVHKVLVNRGVCDNNLSDFGRYLLKLGFAEKVSHGKVKKRETTDIYEIIKKVSPEFRNQRLSEWLDTREKQDAKLQKITDTARRLSQLIPSHKK